MRPSHHHTHHTLAKKNENQRPFEITVPTRTGAHYTNTQSTYTSLTHLAVHRLLQHLHELLKSPSLTDHLCELLAVLLRRRRVRRAPLVARDVVAQAQKPGSS